MTRSHRQDRSRHRRLARHRPRQRARARRGRRPGARALRPRRNGGRGRRRRNPRGRRPRRQPSAPISARPTAPHRAGRSRCATSSATGSTSWSPMPASRKAATHRGHDGRGFRPPCLRSTSARRSSWCSSCCRSCMRGSSVVLRLLAGSACARSARCAAYAATKGAIDTLVKHFAAALGARGIRVNAVAPGVVDTDMSSFAKTEDGRDFIARHAGAQAHRRSRTTSAMRRLPRLATRRAGSPATRSVSTAAPSSEVCLEARR